MGVQRSGRAAETAPCSKGIGQRGPEFRLPQWTTSVIFARAEGLSCKATLVLVHLDMLCNFERRGAAPRWWCCSGAIGGFGCPLALLHEFFVYGSSCPASHCSSYCSSFGIFPDVPQNSFVCNHFSLDCCGCRRGLRHIGADSLLRTIESSR